MHASPAYIIVYRILYRSMNIEIIAFYSHGTYCSGEFPATLDDQDTPRQFLAVSFSFRVDEVGTYIVWCFVHCVGSLVGCPLFCFVLGIICQSAFISICNQSLRSCLILLPCSSYDFFLSIVFLFISGPSALFSIDWTRHAAYAPLFIDYGEHACRERWWNSLDISMYACHDAYLHS